MNYDERTEAFLIKVICRAFDISEPPIGFFSLTGLAQSAWEKLMEPRFPPWPGLYGGRTAEYTPLTPIETELSPWTPKNPMLPEEIPPTEEVPENGKPESYAPKSTKRLWPFGEKEE